MGTRRACCSTVFISCRVYLTHADIVKDYPWNLSRFGHMKHVVTIAVDVVPAGHISHSEFTNFVPGSQAKQCIISEPVDSKSRQAWSAIYITYGCSYSFRVALATPSITPSRVCVISKWIWCTWFYSTWKFSIVSFSKGLAVFAIVSLSEKMSWFALSTTWKFHAFWTESWCNSRMYLTIISCVCTKFNTICIYWARLGHVRKYQQDMARKNKVCVRVLRSRCWHIMLPGCVDTSRLGIKSHSWHETCFGVCPLDKA